MNTVEKAQQSPVVMESRQQEMARRLNNGEHIPAFLETHTGVIEIKSSVENLTQKDLPESDFLKEAYRRGRILTITLPDGKLLGDGATHIDAIDKKSQENHQLAPIQRIAKFLNVTTEELQDRLNIGNALAGETDGYQHPSITRKIISSSEKRFIESSKTKPINERNLFGVTSNVDVIIRPDQETIQEKFNLAIKKIAEIEKKTEEQVGIEISQIAEQTDTHKLPAKVENLTQALGYILWSFKNPGGKVSISHKETIDQLQEIFEFPKNSTKIGGASAQVSDIATAIGEQKSTLYTQFHSPEQAKYHKYNPAFLRIDGDDYTIGDVNTSANPKDPTKTNIVFQIPPNTTINLPNGEQLISKESADRVIFPSDGYLDDEGNKLSARPLFDCNNELLGHLIEEEDISYFFLNGAQYAQRVETLEEYNKFTTELSSQLEQIQQSGAVTHFEFSGNKERKEGQAEWTGVKFFEALRGKIASFGLGDNEVLPIVKSIKAELDPSIEINDGADLDSLYKNGLTILRYFQTQRVYIHGSDNDMVILDNSDNQLTAQDMEKEVNSCNHAKDKTTHHIKGNTPKEIVPDEEKLSRFVKTEGVSNISTFIKKIVKGLSLGKKDSQKLISQTSKNGYFFHGDHAVAVIPIKWIYTQDQIIVTVSSGDITSYLSTLYSGLAERLKRIRRSKTNRTDLVN